MLSEKNRQNDRLRHQVLAMALLILGFYAVFLWNVLTVPAMESIGIGIGNPVHISIPSIALDADIKEVALTPDGLMDVPTNPLDAGWYEPGPRPGEVGSAVIAGHVNWWYGATGVFANLDMLTPGDLITVHDEVGGVITFVVREVRIYDAAADATDIFLSNDGKAHLNLITCSGGWSKSAGQYTKRLVVFTDEV